MDRRLPEGGRIDREAPLEFTFNGRALAGFQGDTLASALLANGVDVVGRSFKHARPRGIIGHGAEEPNAIVEVGEGAARVPNLRATQVELYDGLVARADFGGAFKRMTGAVGRTMPPGFYYKTFMASERVWGASERLLRRAAGHGVVPDGPDPDTYDKMHRHCDVLVVGAGPAGIAAAAEAAHQGAQVIIADEQNEFGGSLLASLAQVDAMPAAEWLRESMVELAELVDFDTLTMLPRSTVFGCYDHNLLGIVERRTDHLGRNAGPGPRQRLHLVRATHVVLATGAIERPLVFAGNDLPGVMLASSVATYLNRYAVAPGERLLLFATNDAAYRLAIAWHDAGREVAAVVDVRPQPDGALPEVARGLGIDVIGGSGITEAIGRRRVQGAWVAPLAGDARRLAGNARRLACDLIAVAGGWSPVLHLAAQTGAKPRWDDETAAFLPGEPPPGMHLAGAVSGASALCDCLGQGARAGAEAALAVGHGEGRPSIGTFETDEASEAPPATLFAVPHRLPTSRAPKQFVDFQLDVTAADIEVAASEGFEAVEHVKRYTALGFGTDQGKLGNVNGVAMLARALGRSIEETGTTMFRPAYTPVTFGAFAGRDVGELFDPERRTPMHDWHESRGAVWEDVGRWKRPRYYPEGDEDMDAAVARECRAVRRGVGIMDASTLGKVDIQGPDAARFLDRVYAGGFRKLGVGRCRYGLMLKDDGTIMDDGVTARLDGQRYLMHTTTGNAEAVFAWLELWRQTEWPELDVAFTSVTDHWATAAVAGPQAREVLAQAGTDVDLSPQAFPFMSVREGEVAGVPARVFRISFSGELAFEVNVPAPRGMEVWQALVAAGEKFGITPYGTETMHVLRAEKGFIIVGQDTDGSMTPHDMGLDWAVRRGKPAEFIGERALDLADHQRADRPQLVGLKTEDPAVVIPEGAQIVKETGKPPLAMHGHVTSSYMSATLSRSIALAMVKGGRDRMGETVYCPLADGRTLAAEIVESVFYDAQGERQRG